MKFVNSEVQAVYDAICAMREATRDEELIARNERESSFVVGKRVGYSTALSQIRANCTFSIGMEVDS